MEHFLSINHYFFSPKDCVDDFVDCNRVLETADKVKMGALPISSLLWEYERLTREDMDAVRRRLVDKEWHDNATEEKQLYREAAEVEL